MPDCSGRCYLVYDRCYAGWGGKRRDACRSHSGIGDDGFVSKTVYLNISQITEVRHKEIQLKDVADVYCDDSAIMNKCKALRIKTIHLDRNKRYIESTLDVIKKLTEMDSTLQINNVGEVNFIIDYHKPKPPSWVWEWAKTIFVCIVCFCGASFAIMMDVLEGEKLVNLCAVVTRYFGGTLLGTGGLVRAYSKAVQEGLKNCTALTVEPAVKLSVTTDYNGIGKIQYLLGQQEITTLGVEYTDRVELTALVPDGALDKVRADITEATSGRAGLHMSGEVYYGIFNKEVILFPG